MNIRLIVYIDAAWFSGYNLQLSSIPIWTLLFVCKQFYATIVMTHVFYALRVLGWCSLNGTTGWDRGRDPLLQDQDLYSNVVS